MTAEALDPAAVDAFIARWAHADGTERANYQLFALDLCELLGVPKPNPASTAEGGNAYVFERNVTASFADGSRAARFIDLYKRGCFVLEAKQSGKKLNSKGQTRTLEQAWVQAEQYARSLPAEEGRPPIIIVVDVGRTIDLYAEFSRSGATYTAFPDANSNRITLADLHKPEVQYRLRRLWTDPNSLDPANYSAKVTRKISDKLAELAKSLEQSGHAAEAVAGFLSRCLFTMFAEDVELLPSNSFRDLLQQRASEPDKAMNQTRALWRDMATGADYSAAIEARVLRFNGGLFKDADALQLNKAQLAMLIDAAKADWRHVEPAIFGTLLERALSPGERHTLGAHYTPRAYVERLVLPTVIEPLREEWKDVQAAAALVAQGIKGKNKTTDTKLRNEAAALLKEFHHRLCNVRVLDPACGSGNFLYVTLDHLKRLEAEVLADLEKVGRASLEAQGITVSPHQLLGIEVNPRAARIAELVLWIGYLQWHYRTFKHLNLPEPVLRDFKNIENRDAILTYDAVIEVLDSDGRAVTSWDGKTYKPSPITGKEIPDVTAQVPQLRYTNPQKATWPSADFVIGNPPFIGNKRMRSALGDGYVDALRIVWDDMSGNADFVMYWWHRAAGLTTSGQLRRFGFITTNSITQVQNRAVVESHIGEGLNLTFAIPDHPWTEATDGANVRIAMTSGTNLRTIGRVATVKSEASTGDESTDVKLSFQLGRINPDLSIGLDVTSVRELKSNQNLAFMGVLLGGDGFFVDESSSTGVLQSALAAKVASRYISGTDLAKSERGRYVIDFSGFDEDQARSGCPIAYQWILDRVKPARIHNNMKRRAERWWIFASDATEMRKSVTGLSRFICTHRTGKHRCFSFVEAGAVVESNVVSIASDDAYILGVLSSAIHVLWSLRAGGKLESRPHYTSTTIFSPFPFPSSISAHQSKIRDVAEAIDSHRKRQQASHSELTLTNVYNVLAKLRGGAALTPREKTIHEQGLVGVLKQLHDELDAAVLEAYGWADLTPGTADFTESVLTRLVALNAQRVAEEAAGTIRWLRPEYQNPEAGTAPPAPEQGALGVDSSAAPSAPGTVEPQAWPAAMAAQFKSVRSILATGAQTAATLAAQFKGRSRHADVAEILDTLEGLGQVVQTDEGRYTLI